MLRQMTATLDRIALCGVLPVVELPDGTDPIALVDALIEGGLRVIEITLRTGGALDAIRAIRAARPDFLVAAGTVLTPAQVDDAVGAGAQLLVSPGFSPHVVDRAIALRAEMLPGVATPSEVEMGISRGLDTFKFFPAEAAGGRRYLAALAGPYARARFVPTGGIDASNLAGYLELPNVLACGGSWMVGRSLLQGGDLAAVSRLAREAREIVRRARGEAAGAVSSSSG
jgi:2-dehydro-3-deoxyphosphogluconate aldolase / (4S)-4-hydroxy-2-oxoglutarate aldolase